MSLDTPPAAPAPRGGGVFHGWKIVGLSLLTQALQAGLLIYAFGTLAVEIEAEFGVSRAQVMLAATVLSLSSNLLSPLFGNLVDRASLRTLMLWAVAALGIGLVVLSRARSIWHVWIVFGTLLPVGNLMLGQLSTSALITRWFARLRGRALGIASVGTSLGGFTFPVLMTYLIERYDWRTALLLIGIVSIVVTAPLVRWLVVDRPADLGLNEDGAAAPPPPVPEPAPGQTATRAILGHLPFWCETVVMGIALFVYLGFLSNLFPHAVSLGIEPTAAAGLMSLVAVFSVAGKLGFGAVADRVDLRLTMGTSFALMIVGSLMLSQLASYAGIAGGAVLFGLAAGGLLPVWGAMVARSFGQARFGRALGMMNLAMAPITLLSAPYAGYLYDRLGDYEVAFASYCGFLLLAGGALTLLRFPGEGAAARRREEG